MQYCSQQLEKARAQKDPAQPKKKKKILFSYIPILQNFLLLVEGTYFMYFNFKAIQLQILRDIPKRLL